MNATAAAPPPPASIGPRQRLNATAVLSLLVHGVLILGLGFVLKGEAPLVPTLDVIFSQTRTELTPEQADFLAQASNVGGGEHDKAQRPRETQAGSMPLAEPGDAPLPEQQAAAVETPPPQERVVASRRGEEAVAQAQPREPLPEPELPPMPRPRPDRARRPTPAPTQPAPPTPTPRPATPSAVPGHRRPRPPRTWPGSCCWPCSAACC